MGKGAYAEIGYATEGGSGERQGDQGRRERRPYPQFWLWDIIDTSCAISQQVFFCCDTGGNWLLMARAAPRGRQPVYVRLGWVVLPTQFDYPLILGGYSAPVWYRTHLALLLIITILALSYSLSYQRYTTIQSYIQRDDIRYTAVLVLYLCSNQRVRATW